MGTLAFSETIQNEIIRKACEKAGFVCDDISRCKTFLAAYTNIAKLQNWETMSMSTALGGSHPDYGAWGQPAFDGRYMYFSTYGNCSYLRFDTTQLFQISTAWEKMSTSTVLGTSSVGASCGVIFDGRYLYYTPTNSRTFVRFDSTKSFTAAASWELMSTSTVQGGSGVDTAFFDGCFDGRYIYYVAKNSDTFVRFDTTLLFTNSSAWERMSMSTVQGAAAVDTAYTKATFDGRYVYIGPQNSDTFLRFDTTLTFTNSSAWERMSMSTAQGAAAVDEGYYQGCFDGRYLYFTGSAAGTMIRFDTTLSFTNSSAWEKVSLSTVQGAAAVNVGLIFNTFDGRYVYFSPCNADTFLRFDTTQSFTNSSAWEKSSMSTAMGATLLDNAFGISGYDGKYVYFVGAAAITAVRILATPQ